ncbi:hypothetical protein SAY86_010660 [Trapa natans]|uniref:RNA helicase n=1 Tax=Trapa natans TaxID=22666 RepID=A0AAN7R218_TRANT|nr:hypothetical protein SAY86_010660 [Trapa natans]
MGKKMKESSSDSESIIREAIPDNELKSHGKKKKDKHGKKEKLQDEVVRLSAEDQNGSGRKRKKKQLGEADPEIELKSEKKKKNKKGDAKGSSENGSTGAEEEVRDGNVVVSGKGVKNPMYAPVESFEGSKLPDEVLECCKGFKKPSPIQSRAWPFLLNGRDFIGIAATGSGKTLAFGLPAIMYVLNKRNGKIPKGRSPLCLVLSPTRELAQQISDVLIDAGKASGVKSVCLYGGTSKEPQRSALKAGIDIVIGTPGRLKDLVEEGACRLSEVAFVVLDEADRMLDMGFEQEVRSILSKTCSARQMVMFSATWPLPVHLLSQEYMDPDPVKVVVGSEDLAANHDVMQIVEVLDDRARDDRLVSLLQKYHSSKSNRVLVFVLYKMEASRVEKMLHGRGWKVVSIHGDKAQHDRTKSLSLFKSGSCPLMVS